MENSKKEKKEKKKEKAKTLLTLTCCVKRFKLKEMLNKLVYNLPLFHEFSYCLEVAEVVTFSYSLPPLSQVFPRGMSRVFRFHISRIPGSYFLIS